MNQHINMVGKTSEHNYPQERQTTISYLRNVGRLSEQEAESLINRLYRMGRTPSREPVIPAFGTAAETVSDILSTETIVFFDLGLNIIQTEGQSPAKIGMVSPDVVGRNLRKVFKSELQEGWTSLYEQVLKGNERELTYTYQNRYYRVLLYPHVKDREIAGGIAIIRDITREARRKVQLNLLFKAIEATEEMVIITDARENIGEEKILYVNKGFENVTGYSRAEVLGKNPSLLQGPDTDAGVIGRLKDNLAHGKRFEGETFNYRKDGTRFRLHWSIDPVTDQTGTVTHFVSVQRDITRQWQQQQQLEQLIADREARIIEIHHRINNNLAVVSGLLELQSHQATSAEAVDMLTQSLNRIKAIATLHEMLYRTNSFDRIELNSYFREIAVRVTDSLLAETKEITIETDIAPVSLSDIQAMPCGLILNEVITNSCKHAFLDQHKCTIRIEVQVLKDDRLLIRVTDNGCGLPEGFDAMDFSTLGMSLIQTLCRQLNAEYSFDSSGTGTSFTMVFTPEAL